MYRRAARAAVSQPEAPPPAGPPATSRVRGEPASTPDQQPVGVRAGPTAEAEAEAGSERREAPEGEIQVISRILHKSNHLHHQLLLWGGLMSDLPWAQELGLRRACMQGVAWVCCRLCVWPVASHATAVHGTLWLHAVFS